MFTLVITLTSPALTKTLSKIIYVRQATFVQVLQNQHMINLARLECTILLLDHPHVLFALLAITVLVERTTRVRMVSVLFSTQQFLTGLSLVQRATFVSQELTFQLLIPLTKTIFHNHVQKVLMVVM